jgi:uncharacterized protein YxjI
MRYVMKQKLFSWADSYVIRDEMERELFQVAGKVFSFGHQLTFQDMNGKDLAFIKQKLLSWGPTFEIYNNNALVAVVKKELFTFFHCKFEVDVPGPDDIEAEGDFLDHEYNFTRQGQVIATVSKQWFSWTDTYGVEIAEDVDPVLILASTVVIDEACHDRDSD